MRETRTALVVDVSAERGTAGLVYATSAQMKGLFVAVRTEEDAISVVPVAISDLLLAQDDPHLVVRAEGRDDGLLGTWVAIPKAMVDEALAMDAQRLQGH